MRLRTFADAAREIGCLPRDVSDLRYAGLLDDERLIPLGNRRLIPDDYLAELRDMLAARGKVREAAHA